MRFTRFDRGQSFQWALAGVAGLVLAIVSTLGVLCVAIPAVSQSTGPLDLPDAALPAGLPSPEAVPGKGEPLTEHEYVVLAWNDLGMHCYNRDYQYLAVLPPYNTLWAQVIQVGDLPRIVTATDGISVTYSLADIKYSVGKSNQAGSKTTASSSLPGKDTLARWIPARCATQSCRRKADRTGCLNQEFAGTCPLPYVRGEPSDPALPQVDACLSTAGLAQGGSYA